MNGIGYYRVALGGISLLLVVLLFGCINGVNQQNEETNGQSMMNLHDSNQAVASGMEFASSVTESNQETYTTESPRDSFSPQSENAIRCTRNDTTLSWENSAGQIQTIVISNRAQIVLPGQEAHRLRTGENVLSEGKFCIIDDGYNRIDPQSGNRIIYANKEGVQWIRSLGFAQAILQNEGDNVLLWEQESYVSPASWTIVDGQGKVISSCDAPPFARPGLMVPQELYASPTFKYFLFSGMNSLKIFNGNLEKLWEVGGWYVGNGVFSTDERYYAVARNTPNNVTYDQSRISVFDLEKKVFIHTDIGGIPIEMTCEGKVVVRSVRPLSREEVITTHEIEPWPLGESQ